MWDASERSEWSPSASFEAGLLEIDDWVARWIEPVEQGLHPSGERPPQVLQGDFDLIRLGDVARLYTTAHGVYEAFLNGSRVGDLELTPGFTSYDARLQVQTFDVSHLLVVGLNRWDVVVSDGWYRGRHGNSQGSDAYGDTLGFFGQLEVDGEPVAATGDGWICTSGPIRRADLMAGQTEDHRVETDNWRPVSLVDHDLSNLTVSPAPPVRRIQEIRPVSVIRHSLDRQVIDLGQNINGWMRLTHLGPAGTELTLVHGEALDASGDVTTEHLEPTGAPSARSTT